MGRNARVILAGLIVAGIAGCSAVQATPSASAGASSAIATASITAVPDASAPAASAATTTSASVAASPSSKPAGTFTSIAWKKATTNAPVLLAGAEGSQQLNLSGWTRGFAEFIWNDKTRTLIPWASSDGVSWKAGPKLDVRAIDVGVPKYAMGCWFQESSLADGPSGLLLTGQLVCTTGAVCGPPWYSKVASWVSTDGLNWALSKLPLLNNGAWASGGSAGYIASDGASLYVAPAGHTWSKDSFPALPLAEDVLWGDVASFDGGFAMTAVADNGGGCGVPSVNVAVVFWSPDGKSWTQEKLPGAKAGTYVETQLDRIGGAALLLREWSFVDAPAESGTESPTETVQAWTSIDGKTWRPVAAGDATALDRAMVYSSGSNCVVVASAAVAGTVPPIFTFDSNLAVVKLTQTGNPPAQWPVYGNTALGPTGLLVTDGTSYWLGTPAG